MNGQIPAAPSGQYKDRSTGLLVFGILTALLGGLCALFLPLMIMGQVLSERMTGVPAHFQAIAPALMFYAILAVTLVWLGIGSIMACRWARALLLIFSWIWLATGLLSMFFMIGFSSKFTEAFRSNQPPGQPPLPPAAAEMVLVITFLMLGVGMVLVPAAGVLFYRSPDVKATCEARRPEKSWTDACPLPVLAVCLVLGFSALTMLLMPFAYNGVLPCFGIFLSGWSGTLGYLALAAVWAYTVPILFQLKVRGWWIVLITLCVMTLSHAMTYARHDIMEVYELMGYPQQQLEQLRKLNFLNSQSLVWGSLIFLVPVLGYLGYIKKYFQRNTGTLVN